MRRNLDRLERLEERTLLTYSAGVVVNAVTFTGDVSADTLTFDTDGGGFLRHNRFTAGDAGFASDIDLVSGDGATVTSILVTAVTSLTVNAGSGNDIIQLNGLTLTSATSVSLNGQGDTDTIETITAAVSVGAGSATLIGETININSSLTANTTASLQGTTVNLANNITAAGGISGTPSIVNVQNTTAEIQDGIDVAGVNSSVNIAAGSYTGNADATAGGKSVTLSPAGAAAVGQVTLSGNLVLDAGDTLQLQLSGLTPATQFDNFVVTGSTTLSGATLVPTISFTAAVSDKLVIISNGVGAVTGTFSGLAEGSFVAINGQTFQITYVDGGNDVALTKYPDPVTVNYTNGSLIITGTSAADDITVTFTGTNSVTLTGNGLTNFSGSGTSGQTTGSFNVTGNISMTMNAGNDRVFLRGLASGKLDSGTVTIDLGTGDDTVTTTDAGSPTAGLTMTGDLAVVGGAGNDTVTLGSATAGDTYAANSVSIDTGAGAAQTVSLNAATIGNNLTITNSGTGTQTAQIGNTTASTVGGKLTITQLGTANTGGYVAQVTNTNVGGNLTIQNGNSTSSSSITVNTTSANRQVVGTTYVTNGANNSNSITLAGTGFDLALTGNITAFNGVATTTNAINLDGLTASGAATASFVNGNAATSNGITFGGSRANTFAGMVAATNGNATGAAATNSITVNRTGISKTTNLTNGNAVATNTVTVGNNTAVTAGANVVIKNGAGTTSDVMGISQLTASGDVTLSNGASGLTTVTLGGAGANSSTGNWSLTNLATTGARTITINNTTVSGRTGLAINNAGAGVSTLSVGTVSAVSIAGKLDVQDGTSNSTMPLQNLTVGSITYNDLGGGVDTINIGNTGVGTTSVSGVTRLNTGLGSDVVGIGSVGASFSGQVVISLGSGNDTLTIGASASSPALNTNRYQFDGESGTDTITASTLSIADYVVTTVPRKLKHKITNFESVL